MATGSLYLDGTPCVLGSTTGAMKYAADKPGEKTYNFLYSTVRLLTHVLCKPPLFFFQLFIPTKSDSLQTNISSAMKDWADKYHVWGTPSRSPSRSNSR